MANDNPSEKGFNFLRIFEEGKKFTQEILHENERLRNVVEKLRIEKAELENQYIKVDVSHTQEKLRILDAEVRNLRTENQTLKDRFTAIEEENREFADRYVQVERQNSNLVNMYVATYRLHSTLVYDEVLKIIKEIVINMVGSEEFGVYAVDEEAGKLILIAHEGLNESEHKIIPIGTGLLKKHVKERSVYVALAGTERQGSEKDPIAIIPLKVGDTLLGVVMIFKLLTQKEGFQALDHDLFELLGGQAATAVYGSKLFTASERKRSTLESFLNLLKN